MRDKVAGPDGPALSEGLGVEPANIGDVVWFRMARMYGNPPVAPVRAMVTKVRDRGCVDLEIGCEGTSEVSGTAGMVQHKASLLGSQIHYGGCWWHGDLPELRDA